MVIFFCNHCNKIPGKINLFWLTVWGIGFIIVGKAWQQGCEIERSGVYSDRTQREVNAGAQLAFSYTVPKSQPMEWCWQPQGEASHLSKVSSAAPLHACPEVWVPCDSRFCQVGSQYSPLQTTLAAFQLRVFSTVPSTHSPWVQVLYHVCLSLMKR